MADNATVNNTFQNLLLKGKGVVLDTEFYKTTANSISNYFPYDIAWYIIENGHKKDKLKNYIVKEVLFTGNVMTFMTYGDREFTTWTKTNSNATSTRFDYKLDVLTESQNKKTLTERDEKRIEALNLYQGLRGTIEYIKNDIKDEKIKGAIIKRQAIDVFDSRQKEEPENSEFRALLKNLGDDKILSAQEVLGKMNDDINPDKPADRAQYCLQVGTSKTDVEKIERLQRAYGGIDPFENINSYEVIQFLKEIYLSQSEDKKTELLAQVFKNSDNTTVNSLTQEVFLQRILQDAEYKQAYTAATDVSELMEGIEKFVNELFGSENITIK